MRRIMLLLTVAALMVAILVANAATASAQIESPAICDDTDDGIEVDPGIELASDLSAGGPLDCPDDIFLGDETVPQNKAADNRGFIIVKPSRS